MKKDKLLITVILITFILSSIGPSAFGGDTTSMLGSFLPPQLSGIIFTHENPANQSTDVSVATTMWNVTITTSNSPYTLNFTITLINSTTGYKMETNSSNDTANGSKYINITDDLSYDTNYTVYVNATDRTTWKNETYWFVTWSATNFTAYSTSSFGGKMEVQGEQPVLTPDPANQTAEVVMYPLLNLTVTDPQGGTMNVTWRTNATGTWVYHNATVTSGSTVSQRATFANQSNTKYWWSVEVNDTNNDWTNETYWFTTDTYSWTNWSYWWTFNYTSSIPTNFTASTYNKTVINLTWDNATDGGWDTNVVVRNESGWGSATYPITPFNGTEIYNGTLEAFNDTGLAEGTTYYYTIWTWNNTDKQYSIINDTASATTQSDIEIFTNSVYPANWSTEIERPATNISIIINGTNLNVYFYFVNETALTNVTSLFASWTGQNTQRFEFTGFGWTPRTDWMWGNREHLWTVNVTDGTTWVNQSFNYTSLSAVDGHSARFDVQVPLNIINIGDAQATWGSRDYVYNRIYDVQVPYGLINIGDAQFIWNERTT